MTNTQTMRQRCVHIKHFPGHALSAQFIGLHRPNRTGALRQLDQRHAHVVDHGDEHLANIVFLPVRLTQYWLFALYLQVADGSHSQDAAQLP